MRPALLAIILILGSLGSALAGETAPGDFPVWIDLDKPQLVTVVIEDGQGMRVRNLVAEMQLPAGKNRLSWDGYDDGQRTAEGDLVRKRVAPGSYRARGLTHDGITLTYEFTVYSGGNPPWPNQDRTGGWLADHSCPLGAVFLPAQSGSPYGDGKSQVLLTALVAEAGSPLVWVGTDGATLQRRQVWGWDGAIAATRDAGKPGDPDIYAYLLMAWDDRIAIRGLKKDGSGVEVVSYKPDKKLPREPRHEPLTLAVRDGLLVFTSPTEDALVIADVASRKILDRAPLAKPTGLAFDAGGRLLAISEGKVLRFRIQRSPAGAVTLAERAELIGKGLENPRSLAFDPAGKELYVADWGKSHQVKVFTPEGKPLRSIGTANDGTQLGLYDELKMQAPLGLAIDDQGQLWVAEASHLPKRISLWNARTGAFLRAHYGPPRYGGGGTIDPADKTRLFYQDFYGLMEFALDWKTGTAKPKAICVNAFAGGTDVVAKYGIEYDERGPSRWNFVNERPVTVGGRTYIVGGWQGGLRGNDTCVTWLLGDDHIARPVSRVGSTRFSWPPQLNAAFNARAKGLDTGAMVCSWTDRNGDGRISSDEYDLQDMPGTWIDAQGKTQKVFGLWHEIVLDDLSVTTNWAVRVPPPVIDAKGLPIYDLNKAEYLLPHDPMFQFDEQFHWGVPVLPVADGWVVAGSTGWREGKRLWSYPDAGAGPAVRGGELVQPTRLLGPPAKAASGEAGQWFAVNGEKGNMYLMTSDGLFLQTLGGDMRTTPLLRLPKAERGMVIDRPGAHVSFEDEHFHPTMTTTKAGEIYLVAGKEHSSIFRVDGFASVRRTEFAKLTLDAATLARLPEQDVIPAIRQGKKTAMVECGGEEPVVDGKLDEYAAWAEIGRGRAATARIAGKRLYAAWRTGEKEPLANSGGDYRFLFKRGGCVDLMISTDPQVEHKTADPVAGDVRLLVTTVKGATKAVLYRAVKTGRTGSERVQFTSPVGEVWFDEVVDVSAQVKLAQAGGDVEISCPLDVLGLVDAGPGRKIRADFGILRGDGTQVIQRLYWNNLDTLIVSDIPSEARLQPRNWGEWSLVQATSRTPLPAVTVSDAIPGLACRYFEGNWHKVPDVTGMTPAWSGVASLVGLAPKKRNENFALEFTGFLRVPTAGVWTLTINSDDGSKLWVHDALVADNDGDHAPQDAFAPIALAAGLHPIRIAYYQGAGGAGLELRWSGPGVREQPVPAEALLHKP